MTVNKFHEDLPTVSAVTAEASQNLAAGNVMSVSLPGAVEMKVLLLPARQFQDGPLNKCE